MDRGSSQDFSGMLPRPGKALKAVLFLILGLAVVNVIAFNWVPEGNKLFVLLACTTDGVLHHWRLWTLLTAGLLTFPHGAGFFSNLLFTLIGLYFLSPDLERRWGARRFVRFLAVSVVFGFLLAIGIDAIAPPQVDIFHPKIMFGAGSALTAIAVAWSRQNKDLQVRLFFVLPVRGSWLFWLTVGYCVLGVVAQDDGMTTGAVAPFGGLVTGLLLGETPSALRRGYLRIKLAVLRKRGAGSDRPGSPRLSRSSRSGGPPLRVVYGGLEDDLKNRKPPKDKRYLN